LPTTSPGGEAAAAGRVNRLGEAAAAVPAAIVDSTVRRETGTGMLRSDPSSGMRGNGSTVIVTADDTLPQYFDQTLK
jgi:hypothetical protein